MRTITLIEAIKEAMQEEMRLDDSVFLVGQDIRGGIFPHTKGLVEEFGAERIVDTPIAESGMFGVAFGAAQEGFRPIVDFMFGGFSYVTFSECSVTTGQYPPRWKIHSYLNSRRNNTSRGMADYLDPAAPTDGKIFKAKQNPLTSCHILLDFKLIISRKLLTIIIHWRIKICSNVLQ